MACPYHRDGWHKSLIVMQSAQKEEVEHTCACWLPNPPGSEGKLVLNAVTVPNADRL